MRKGGRGTELQGPGSSTPSPSFQQPTHHARPLKVPWYAPNSSHQPGGKVGSPPSSRRGDDVLLDSCMRGCSYLHATTVLKPPPLPTTPPRPVCDRNTLCCPPPNLLVILLPVSPTIRPAAPLNSTLDNSFSRGLLLCTNRGDPLEPLPSTLSSIIYRIHLAVVNAWYLLTLKARGRWTTVQSPAMETLNPFSANTMAR